MLEIRVQGESDRVQLRHDLGCESHQTRGYTLDDAPQYVINRRKQLQRTKWYNKRNVTPTRVMMVHPMRVRYCKL